MEDCEIVLARFDTNSEAEEALGKLVKFIRNPNAVDRLWDEYWTDPEDRETDALDFACDTLNAVPDDPLPVPGTAAYPVVLAPDSIDHLGNPNL